MSELRKLASPDFLRPARRPAPASWYCPVCGEVPPLLKPSGEWIQRTCLCQRREKAQALALEKRLEQQEAMATWTYGGWLGAGWVDERSANVLSKARFENYDTERTTEYNELRWAVRTSQDPSVKKIASTVFQSFEKDRERWRSAKQVATSFAANPSGVLLLTGSYGLGKTHLLAACCNALRMREQPRSSLFVTGTRFFSAIYERMSQEEDHWSLIKAAISTPLMVFDDFDKIGEKDFRKEIFLLVVDERCNLRKPIAISANSFQALSERVGEAAMSRLTMGLQQVDLPGQDYRAKVVIGGAK